MNYFYGICQIEILILLVSPMNHPWSSTLPKTISWIYIYFPSYPGIVKTWHDWCSLARKRRLLIGSGPLFPWEEYGTTVFLNLIRENRGSRLPYRQCPQPLIQLFLRKPIRRFAFQKTGLCFWTHSGIGWGKKRLQLNSILLSIATGKTMGEILHQEHSGC